jgi:hypothetical protein
MANGKDGARRMCAAAQRERPWLKGVPAEHFLRHPGASGETNRTLRSVTAHKAAEARRAFLQFGWYHGAFQTAFVPFRDEGCFLFFVSLP